MCDEPCVACSKTCDRNGDQHRTTIRGETVHGHDYVYGSFNRSGAKNVVTVRHEWYSVPTLDDEVRRLA